MSQNYIPTKWEDNKTVGTASIMNNIEKGINNAHDRIDSIDSQIKNIVNNGIVSSTKPADYNMPRVFIYGDALPTTKTDVLLTMEYISNTDKFSSYIKLKCQGTSSMSYAKKNFTINMYSDEARTTKLKKDFEGWGAQSKFCLKANWVDTTHTRNISGARIGYDIVASRPDSAFKQQLLTAPRYGLVDGFPIKLYFNGEFHGIYTWNIPKDAWQFNMDESNPNHCVLCAETNTDGNDRATSCNFRKLWSGSGEWSVEVGTASAKIKASFDRCINFVMTATDKEFHDNIGQYFDLYSLLDYYCFSYLTCHLDGLAKNMLMATYDGVIWGASLYDMDSIYGVHYNGGSFVATNYKCPEQYQEQFSLLWKRIEECFGVELYARYLELRQGALSLSNIIKHVEEIYDVIPDRVFADEKAKWTNLPQVSANTMTRFRNYMRDRAKYVDAEMLAIGNPPTDIPCTSIALNKTELVLGAIEGSGEFDTTTNLLDGATWSTGTVSVDNGQLTSNNTDKVTTITIANPGVYQFSYGSYTYGKVVIWNGDVLAGTYQMNNSNPITFVVHDANSTVHVSCYPGTSGFDSSVSSIVGVSSIADYCSDISDNTITVSSSNIAISNSSTNDITVFEMYSTSGVSYVDKGLAIKVGDKLLKSCFLKINSNRVTNTSLLNTMYNNGYCYTYSYNNAEYILLAVPSSWGKTADAIATYMNDNNLTITVNPSEYISTMTGSGGTSSITKLTEQLTATVEPSNTTDTITWSSNATNIATVSNGLVTAKANGNAIITATCGSQSATCNVTVSGIAEGGGGSDSGATYTDIGYIESSGTQYIDTGIVPTLSTKIEFVADVSFNKQWAHFFGANNFIKLQWNNSGEVYVIKKNGSGSVGLTSGKHTFVMDMTDKTNSITIDGTNYTTTIGNVEGTENLLLLLSGYSNGGGVETGYCGVGKIYSCKIYDGDNLVRDMKPVLSSDGVYGLLDTVNNVFYDSEVGSFTGGGAVSTKFQW